MRKQYLGDGVYLEYDGANLILTTENGISVTNRIVLEWEVFQALNKQAALLVTASGESAS